MPEIWPGVLRGIDLTVEPVIGVAAYVDEDSAVSEWIRGYSVVETRVDVAGAIAAGEIVRNLLVSSCRCCR